MKCPAFDTIRGDNSKIKILIVDDLTDNIEIVASVLAPEGFVLLYAQSGRECIETAIKEQPDIILLDIMMPEMDGLETCKTLRENISTAYISIIFLTAKIDDETLASSFAIGANDYITKPFSTIDLLSRVYNQLRLIYKQEALTLAQERLAKAEKNQFLGLLAGGIAHDFNNQLNGIMGFSDLIKDRTSDDKIIRLADLITECGERCAALTNNLLAFAGKGKYQIKDIDIAEIIQATKQRICKKYPNIRILVNSVIRNPIVVGDYNQIDSVIQTVAINAAEAMMYQDSGVLIFDIAYWDGVSSCSNHELTKIDNSKYIAITVTDTGVGIAEENIERVFEPFFTTKDLSTGGGMSLAAAYGIIENHGGEIKIESKVGEGTTVLILLPKEIDDVSNALFEQKLVTDDNIGNDIILVIDDNKMSRVLLEDIISAQSGTVLTASSGALGVELYAKYKDKIRMVFLDYVMPQMTGKEALEKILELDSMANVYMISGYKSEQSVRELIDIGAKGFIKKPFKCKEILDIL